MRTLWRKWFPLEELGRYTLIHPLIRWGIPFDTSVHAYITWREEFLRYRRGILPTKVQMPQIQYIGTQPSREQEIFTH
jgi:hypothetical protein